MAKLNAPLFSFRASGKIAKALVFFGWKGLNVVRSYVVPANPQSDLQIAHRAHLIEAVERIHTAQRLDDNPLGAKDISAYALWGSIYPTPRTWFNQVVKNWIDRRVAKDSPAIFRDGDRIGGTDTTADLTIYITTKVGEEALGAANVFYGTSKTSLIKKTDDISITDTNIYNVQLANLVKSTTYYWQLVGKDEEDGQKNKSGIYFFKTLAA